MNTKHERLRAFRKTLGLTQDELAQATGLKPSQITAAERIPKEGAKVVFIGPERIKKLQDKYNLNPSWLVYGEGEMFLSKEGSSSAQAEIIQPTAMPSLQKYGEAKFDYPNPDLQLLIVTLNPSNDELVRVVDEPAFASYHAGYRDVNYTRQLQMETVPTDLKGKGTISKFFIYGDSMSPSILHGDYVFASYVERTRSRYTKAQFKIKDKHIYIVNSRSQGLMIKRLYYHEGSDYIECSSDNREHPKFSIPFDDVQELWYFRRRYTAQVPEPEDDLDIEDLRRGFMYTAKTLGEVQKTLMEINKGIQLTFDFVKQLKPGK